MRKYGMGLLVFLFLIAAESRLGWAAAPDTAARGAVVMDVASGRVLYQKNPHEKMPMASTTKIMTAILAIEKGHLQDIVTISDRAYGVEGSSIYLERGEKITLENLLYGLMLRSGNDAAVAIAEHIGGSVDKFVEMMNEKALEIGARNTHFVNPNGLHHKEHYTTAYDLALISAYAMKNPVFRTIVATKYKRIPWEGHEWDRVMQNKNRILWEYEGGNGIKTGYTKAANRCLAAAAQRNNMQLVSVVLNCHSWFDDSMALLDYGFKEYHPHQVFTNDQVLGEIDVRNGSEKKIPMMIREGVVLPLKEGEEKKIEVKIQVPFALKAPVKAGTRIGVVDVRLGDELRIRRGIYVDQDVRENSFLANLRRILERWIMSTTTFLRSNAST
jgi:D-alanyl-D-alanine carboxypeptidase (penicillin-binding protein 5/6)